MSQRLPVERLALCLTESSTLSFDRNSLMRFQNLRRFLSSWLATRATHRTFATRDPRPLPQMWMNPDVKDLFAFTYSDFKLLNYNPHPHIKAAVSV